MLQLATPGRRCCTMPSIASWYATHDTALMKCRYLACQLLVHAAASRCPPQGGKNCCSLLPCKLRRSGLTLQVKQTVMTSVYGVTFIGARQQISNRLKDKGWTHDDTIFRVSNYGARVRTRYLPSAVNVCPALALPSSTCLRDDFVAHVCPPLVAL